MQKDLNKIFLADDDEDDCLLFEEALFEIDANFNLTICNDGVELMNTFDTKVPPSPRLLFLDINMPRKNGFECLIEMKQTEKLKDIPVIVFSTSGDHNYVNQARQFGAHYYIRKPGTFNQLKIIIEKVLTIDWENNPHIPFDSFLKYPNV